MEWKDVKGFEEYYRVSDSGIIVRKHRLAKTKKGTIRINEKVLSPVFDKDGYLKTAFRVDGKRYYRRVHRIVASTFIDNPDNHPVVNHKNGVKDDNRAENLEWCTVQQNTQHGFDVLGRVGHNGGTNRQVAKKNKTTEEILEIFDSIKAAGLAMNCSATSIWQAMQDKNNTSKGFKWEYYNEGVTTIESTS